MGLDMGLQSYSKGMDRERVAAHEEYYWRKANMIHKWFVDNIQEGADDCGEYLVSKKDLITLWETITDILNEKNYKKRKELAKELLPTYPGFFFGSYEYDDWYFSTLETTQKELGKLLNRFDFVNNKLEYWSSW